MHALIVSLRLVHVFSGILWVGFGLFGALVLGPALERMGQDAGKVMTAIGPAFHTKIMPLVAMLTLLSGFWLYWIMSGGLSSAYVHSTMGATYAVGGLAALMAFLTGLLFIKPRMSRSMALMQQMASTPPEQKGAIAEQARQLREAALAAGKVGTTLLIVATICMAVARYL
jgi:hypothetical protein